MKTLYIMAAVMIVGLLMMSLASYKVFSVAQEAKEAGSSERVKSKIPGFDRGPEISAPASEVMPFVMISYIGLTLFIVGGAGAIFAAFKAMTHRF